ncbi:uncharacterized protein VTP21DRAFT_863 [Calcarisporiella thermophila]|uniref:uncharacterized protein n=1 Tax=Calcarisporiella thermophila TaxID=911321 RepID=UPI00374302B9
MKTALVFVGALLPILSIAAEKIHYEPCGNSQLLGRQSIIQVTPDPPKAGESISIVVTVVLDTLVAGGTSTLSSSVGALSLADHFNLCEIAASGGDRCPLQPGRHHFKLVHNVPALAANQRLDFKFDAKTDDSRMLFCFSGYADVVQ